MMDSKILAQLKAAAEKPARPASPENPGAGNANASIVSEAEALQGTETANYSGLPGESGATASPNAATGAATGIRSPNVDSSPAGGSTVRPVNVGQLVGGKFAVDLMDTLIPSVALLAFSALGYEIEKRGLQLNEREKAVIAPAMQDYLNSINVNLNNPLYNLLLVVGVVYGSKIMETLPKVKRKTGAKKPEPEKVEDKAEQIKEKIEESKAQQTKIQAFREQLSKVEKPVALKMIEDYRKKGKRDAVAYYAKYVSQAKQ